MILIDRIAECLDDTHRQRDEPWVGAVVHRILVPGHTDAASIARFDRQHEGVGHRMAYHLVVLPDGRVEQALPLSVVAWHARHYSRDHVGVACVGDFRPEHGKPPPDAQVLGLVEVLRELRAMLARRDQTRELAVWGHTSRRDATAYRGHDCPGALLDLDAVRARVFADRVRG